MKHPKRSIIAVRKRIVAMIVLIFSIVMVSAFGVKAQASSIKYHSGSRTLSSKKVYRLYSNLIKKKNLKYYTGIAKRPVNVYVHDVDQDGIPEVFVGYYVFTIYKGKAVKAGSGARYKGGTFCYYSFDDTTKQIGVSNSIDYLATYKLINGKIVMISSCEYGFGEQERKWNNYFGWFRSHFSDRKSKSCKTMKAVLKYLKKKL